MGNTIEQWRASIGGWTRGNILATSVKSGESSSSSPWFQLLVLVILLIIGGIEINPGPNSIEMHKYEKKEGCANMTGEYYEVKMLALLFLRAIQTGQEFQIASNMKAAGNFDDVVLTLGNCTVFLQLKHKVKSETVLKLRDFTHGTTFNLSKYLKSYQDIKQDWKHNTDLQKRGKFEDAKFVIYTNAEAAEDLVNIAGSSRLLSIISTGGKCVCLTELFESLPKYKEVLSAAVMSENATVTLELWDVVYKLHNKQARTLPGRTQLERMLEQLESLGDLTSYQQFISQLYLCTGEKTEKDLDDLISNEILATCGTRAVFRNFMDRVLNWWRSSNCYLTVKTKILQDIIETISDTITKDISTLKVRFVQNECDSIREKLSSGNRMLYIHTQCTKLSCVKVLQSFQTKLLVDVSTLETRLSEVLAVWKLGSCNVLVVEGETTDTNILHKLANMPGFKHVVIISDTPVHAELYQEFKYVSYTDTFCLSQLDSNSQHEVLEHEVVFQGLPVKLNSLANTPYFKSALTADVLVELYNSLQIGQKLNDKNSCYVPRTFWRREYVSEEIFREKHITLAVTGISEYKLTELVTDDVKIQKDKICKYFHIEEEAEFTALCGINKNIHWIEANRGSFLWKKSKGDMSPVIKHLKQECISYDGTEELITSPEQVLLVVAEPGMGKSTEMGKIAQMVKHKDPSMWVVLVDLNKYTNLFSQNQVNAVEFLAAFATLNTEFQKHLFEHALQSTGNVVILLDGFDEISPIYSEQIFSLLRELRVYKVEKIVVTSRPILRNELEQKLSTLSFSFNKFTPNDQENFLIRHWNQLSIHSPDLSEFIALLLQRVRTSMDDNLIELTGLPLQCRMLGEVYQDQAAHYCRTGEVELPQNLDVLELYDKFVDKNWEVYCKKLNEGVSNVMLKELIQNQKHEFQQSHMNCAVFSYLDQNFITSLQSSENILNLNQDFVDRFKSGLDKTGLVTDIVNNKAVFVHRTFTEYFVAMWFSKNFDSEFNGMKNIYFNDNFEIVQKMLDRKLAQEFDLHSAVLNKNLTEVKKLLSIQNSNVNQKDKGGRTALHLAIMNFKNYRKHENYSHFIQFLCHDVYRVNNNYNVKCSIVETLLKHGADVNCEDKVFRWRPLRLAEEIRAWSVVGMLLEKQANNIDLIWIRHCIKRKFHFQNPRQVARTEGFVQSVISVLKSGMSVQYRMNDELQYVMYVALCLGYVNLVEFILKCGVSVGRSMDMHIDPTGEKEKVTMLHIAALHGQLRMVQCLIEHGANVDVRSEWRNRTPLMNVAQLGHVQISEYLINNGASVNARCKLGNTALILAAERGKCEIVELLLQRGADCEAYNKYKQTALLQAAMWGHVLAAHVLINNGASVNARDENGYTALSKAIYKGKNELVQLLLQNGADVEIYFGNTTPLIHSIENCDIKITELLINHGASVNTRCKNGNTALSVAISQGRNECINLLLDHVPIYYGIKDTNIVILQAGCGNIKAIDYLSRNKIINSQDERGDTALLIAASLGKYEIVELLLQKGTDVDISDNNNKTPLMWAVEKCFMQVAEFLINHGASVNAQDSDGSSSLLLAAGNGKYEIVELLLEKGADVEISGGAYNRTPLIQAAENGHVETAELLVKHGASVNARDKLENTALALASYNRRNEIVASLLHNGANVEVCDDVFNRTPLMWAAMYGDVQMVELLINHGASVNAKNKYGRTALSLTSLYKPCIKQLLLQHGAHDKFNSSYC